MSADTDWQTVEEALDCRTEPGMMEARAALARRREAQKAAEKEVFSLGVALDATVKRAEKAEARVAALEAALQPFAKAGDRLWNEGSKGYRNGTYNEAREMYRFLVGEILQARDALASSEGSSET